MNKVLVGIILTTLMGLAVVPAVSIASSAPRQIAPMRASQSAVTIVALDSLSFDPDEVSVTPGQVIVVINEGFLQHNLAVDAWGIDTGPLDNGKIASFMVPEDAATGTSVEFHCTVPGHAEAGQTGTFTVVAADGTEPDAAGGESTPAVAEVAALDSLKFSPSQLEVYPGQEIRVTNSGVMQHDLVTGTWNIATDLLDGGEQVTFTVPDDAEIGSVVTFYCSVPGHQQAGMEGTFFVVAPPTTQERSAIADLEATIAALKQQQADLSATATAIATQQAQIDEEIVTLEIQRDALIEATAAAQRSPTPTASSGIRSSRPERPAPVTPTPTAPA